MFIIPRPVYIKIHAVVVFGGCVIKDLQTRVRSIYYLYFKLSFGLTMNDEILMVDIWCFKTSPVKILLMKAVLFKNS